MRYLRQINWVRLVLNVVLVVVVCGGLAVWAVGWNRVPLWALAGAGLLSGLSDLKQQLSKAGKERAARDGGSV
jgi:hypothetical protein